MSSSLQVVESIVHQVEALVPRHGELGVGDDVGQVRSDVDMGVEFLGGGSGNHALGLLDVFVAKQKLSVEVGEVDGVQIKNGDLAKAQKHQVLSISQPTPPAPTSST